MLKLNLGSGSNKIEGWHNVDKVDYGQEEVADIEKPWPWADNSADEVLFNHSLEHVGQSPDVFLSIMKELYRVCIHGAHVYIHVPHPCHEDYIGDPTHVRPIIPATFYLFSKTINREAERQKAANSRLGLLLDVDFNVVSVHYVFDERFAYLQGDPTWERMMLINNNVVREIKITLQVIKDA